jgi:hypothetical protein
MQKFLPLLFLAVASSLFAGTPDVTTTATSQNTSTLAPVPIDYIETETAYVFSSDFTSDRHNFGSQDSWQNEFEYAHRFLISGNWYLRAGLNYDRFDFSKTDAPLPIHLQTGQLVLGIDYMHGEDVGAFIQIRPGIYTENHINMGAFDCPILIGRFFVIKPDELYILAAVRGSFLSGEFPVVPLAGIVWTPSKQFRIMAVPPEPRVIYSVNKALDVWIGGEIAGSAFRTDNNPGYQLRGGKTAKLSGAVVDYTDYRAGVGFTYSPTDRLDLDFSGGYSLQRNFDFSRADQSFRTDPAPYVKMEIHAKF